MNRRQILRCLTFTTLGTGTFIATTPGAEAGTTGGKPRDALRVGDSMRFDSDLRITFLAVTDDSRCPINAQCVSAGDAEIILRIKAGNQQVRNYRLHTDDAPRQLVIPANVYPPGMTGIPKSYVIETASLNPLPTAGKKTRQTAYRLQLRIDVAV